MIRYGRNIFFAALDVVLSYVDVPAMFLSFHYRPPHEQDPGGLRHEKRQAEAGVSCSSEQETPSQTAGGSPSGEVPSSSSGSAPNRPKPKPMLQKKPKVAPSPRSHDDVPTLNEDELREMIKQDELREQKKRHPTPTRTRSATVRGKVNVGNIRREEEIQEILERARANPWHLYNRGVLKRMDANNRPALSHYGDGQVKITPWNAMPPEARVLLGEEYNYASWMLHPLSGYGVHFFLRAFEYGKLQGTTSPSSSRSRTPM